MAQVQAQLDEATYLKQVREQYENLPYPPRDPAKELEGLIFAKGCALDRINFYGHGGLRDFSKPYHILVAGCGTGDAVVTLAAQLYGSPARITALDMSTASLAVARGRVEARGLDNVRFVHDSLLNVSAHADAPYDHINCIGVLHHLESPEAGLAALEKVLAPSGVMHLMLYARYGRESVYQMQALMRMINGDEPNIQRKVEACRKVLEQLPPGHGFRQFAESVVDIKLFGDSGLYDLLLHSQDVAYTVPQVYDFLATSGMQPLYWVFGHDPKGNDMYRPEGYLHDAMLLAGIQAKPLREQQAIAELMHGYIGRHEFYAARRQPAPVDIAGPDMVPQVNVMLPEHVVLEIAQMMEAQPKDHVLRVEVGRGAALALHNTAHAAALIRRVDGTRSLREIFAMVRAGLPAGAAAPDDAQLQREFATLFTGLQLHDILFLRHRSVPQYRHMEEASAVRGAAKR